MSGTTLMRKPMTAKEEEKSYKGVLDALEIKDGSPEDRIKALIQVPFEKFLTIPRSVGWAWCVDGDFVDRTLSHAELAALSGQTSKAISAMPAAALVPGMRRTTEMSAVSPCHPCSENDVLMLFVRVCE